MNKLQFKTNIKCSGCVAATTPFLNETVGAGNWEVDVQDPSKVLTVTTGQPIDAAVVKAAVEKAGYQAEQL